MRRYPDRRLQAWSGEPPPTAWWTAVIPGVFANQRGTSRYAQIWGHCSRVVRTKRVTRIKETLVPIGRQTESNSFLDITKAVRKRSAVPPTTKIIPTGAEMQDFIASENDPLNPIRAVAAGKRASPVEESHGHRVRSTVIQPKRFAFESNQELRS